MAHLKDPSQFPHYKATHLPPSRKASHLKVILALQGILIPRSLDPETSVFRTTNLHLREWRWGVICLSGCWSKRTKQVAFWNGKGNLRLFFFSKNHNKVFWCSRLVTSWRFWPFVMVAYLSPKSSLNEPNPWSSSKLNQSFTGACSSQITGAKAVRFKLRQR